MYFLLKPLPGDPSARYRPSSTALFEDGQSFIDMKLDVAFPHYHFIESLFEWDRPEILSCRRLPDVAESACGVRWPPVNKPNRSRHSHVSPDCQLADLLLVSFWIYLIWILLQSGWLRRTPVKRSKVSLTTHGLLFRNSHGEPNKTNIPNRIVRRVDSTRWSSSLDRSTVVSTITHSPVLCTRHWNLPTYLNSIMDIRSVETLMIFK